MQALHESGGKPLEMGADYNAEVHCIVQRRSRAAHRLHADIIIV